MSLQNHTRVVTPGLDGTMVKMTVLIVTITAPPTREVIITAPPAAHIGQKAASAEVGLCQ
jgi:hypothetical protein